MSDTITLEAIRAAAKSPAQRVFVDDPDAMKFYEHRADAMTLSLGDIIPNRGELWRVVDVIKKGNGAVWQIKIQSPRGTEFIFDPRWDHLGRMEGDPELRNLKFFRPRPGF